ncbi:MAG: NADPH:quinone oxidoreductase family protein [Pseudomonadaceae bacterium]|nr:NADPH:quinone oxidoreductase family protein [Pseudomonadaceae bacterium]
MKSVVCTEFGPPSALKRVDRDMPEPGPGQVRVRIAAAGVGFVDGLMIQGKYQVKPSLPYYPGGEFAGVVDAVASDVENLTPGMRVFGLVSGAFSDYLLAPAASLTLTPARLDDATAAGFFINYLTMQYAYERCGPLFAGETVLVLGAAGGVGSAAIALAKSFGARVIAAASSDEKRDFARACGADEVVDYTQDDWRASLKSLTAQSGLDMVVDPVGGAVAEPALRSLSPGGRYLVIGFASGEIPKFPANLVLLKRCSVLGVDWGGEARANPSINEELLRSLLELVGDGRLTPAGVVTRPMEEVCDALDAQLAGKIVGKLVLTNSEQ